MPIVLVENEVTVHGHDYADRTGVVYHFPRYYLTRFTEGDAFIYYRGERRLSGARKPAEYFGYGTIGSVWQDPRTLDSPSRDTKWFAEIRDYRPFPTPVLARQETGFLETVSGKGHWRNSVRRVGDEVVERVLALAFGQKGRFALATSAFEVPVPALFAPRQPAASGHKVRADFVQSGS